MPPVVGIDFGTSKSCVGIFRDNEVEIIRNQDGDRTTPSCVAFAQNGRSIGVAATEKRFSNSAHTILDVKRLMPPLHKLSYHEFRHLSSEIREDYLQKKYIVEVKLKDQIRTFTLEEISAMIIGNLKSAVESHLGLPPSSALDCVMTVPASFNAQQCQSIIDGCTIAGFRVLRTISEPTAAALAYHVCIETWPLSRPATETVVISSGAGFTSVSILACEVDEGYKIFEVLSTSGITRGGRDIDQHLVDYLAKDFDDKHNTHILMNSKAYHKLQQAAEKAKRVLSSSDQTSILIEMFYDGEDYHKVLTRRELEDCCLSVFRDIKEFLRRTLLPFKKPSSREVLLVGGLTRMPQIQRLVSEYFEPRFVNLNRSINAEEAAVMGASILGDFLSGNYESKITRNFLLIDLTPLSIRVDLGETTGTVLVPKGTTVPTLKSETFAMNSFSSDTLRCSIFQGDIERLRANLLICTLELSDSRLKDADIEFKLTVDVGYDSKISVVLDEKTTGRRVKSELKYFGFSVRTVRNMKAEAEAMLLEDKIDTRRTILKHEIESQAYTLLDKYDTLKLASVIKDSRDQPWRAGFEEVLGWMEQSPYAELHEFQSKLSILTKLSQGFAETFEDGIATNLEQHAKHLDSVDEGQSSREPRPTPATTKPVYNTTNIPIRTNGQRIDESATRLAEDDARGPAEVISDLEGFHPLRAEIDERDKELLAAKSKDSNTESLLDSWAERPMPLSPPATPLLSTEARLSTFFAETRVPRSKYSDQELQDISTILRAMGRQSWSAVPRIYTVLRNIGELHLLDDFIDLGVTDIFFPFSATSLPEKLSPTVRARFVDAQNMVFTVALELEKGPERRHATFGRDDVLPFEVIARLGSGGYGHVDKVISLLSHKEYARKMFRRKKMFSREKEGIKSFKNELNILRRVDHRHCVELVCSYTDPKYLALVMSPVADCNLAVYYNLAAGSLDKLSLLRGFYGCLANALQYLHNSKIRHRDIKPENILIKGSNVLLTDFGLSFDWEHLSRGTTTADLAKTPVYAAPEVAFFEPKKNSASDIWSLGCVFLEMVTVLKGESVSAMREFFKSRKDNYRYYDNLDSAKEWTKRLAKLGLEEDSVPVEWIANMLEVDPKERPTAATVYREILECEAKLRFCAPCCDHDETDETDTDGGSEDRDLWADTMQETVRGP